MLVLSDLLDHRITYKKEKNSCHAAQVHPSGNDKCLALLYNKLLNLTLEFEFDTYC